jgi:hypothetical protein
MLLFRSEEHLDAWIEMGNPRGELMSMDQQWELAQRWFGGRHLASWNKRTPGEAEGILRSVGLTSDFWGLS